MDLIPILLGSLPLAHNAQHSLVILLFIYIRISIIIFTSYKRKQKYPLQISRFAPAYTLNAVRNNWGERERATTLLIPMEIVYVRARACARPTARLRMREIGIPHIPKCLRHLRRLF